MDGVDRSDQVSATCQSTRKYVKWYKKVFFYVLDICIANAFALHKSFNGSKSFPKFKLTLVKEIILQANLPDWYTK